MISFSLQLTVWSVCCISNSVVRTMRYSMCEMASEKPKNSSEDVTAPERIDARIEELGDWRGEKLAELRSLIHDAEPDVQEGWKSKGFPGWSYNGTLLVGDVYKDKVRLTFHSGAALKDPKNIFNADLDGDKRRAIDLFEGNDVDKTAFKAIVRQAVSYNTRQLLAKAKGGMVDGKPVLLSGGNPQIPKSDGDAPIRTYIDAIPGWKRETTRRIDEIIVENVPGVLKAVRWNSPFYGVEGQGWFVSYHMFSRYIKVTFLNGATLQPEPPGSGKDPDARWIDIQEGQLDEAQLANWIRQSSTTLGWDGF